MRALLFLLLIGVSYVAAKHVDLPPPYNDYCILKNKTNLYQPKDDFPWYEVNLDLPPMHRWDNITQLYANDIKGLIGVLINLVTPIFPNALQFVDTMFGDIAPKLPDPYRSEIMGISQVSGVPLGQIVVYNIFYEIFTVCTSIIAQDDVGKIIHARNLDFGLFLGWDANTHEWLISSHLRKMIINVRWMRGGKLVYKSNNFAGYVGIYNGMVPNGFAVTANERFSGYGGWGGMYKWYMGDYADAKWMSWLTRETLETYTSYADAKNHLMNTPMMSPVYYILSGVNPWEGSIITRALNGTVLLTEMDRTQPYGWYLLETNYDQNKAVLYLDDRRTPGHACMHELGQDAVSFQGIYNVLSSRTNLNKLTTYTVLMSSQTGEFETHQQGCPGYCWPF